MTQAALPLTALSEAQRTQALERLEIIRPALEKHVSQAQVARTHQLPPSTVQLWIKRYREKGLAGLANATRSDKGKSRRLPEQAITLVEGLALQTPPRSAASIHRQVVEIAKEQGWKPPSYERVRLIIKNLAPALVTMAHQGAAAYREEFDLLYRREASHSNAMWQADHCELPILLLDEAGEPIGRADGSGLTFFLPTSRNGGSAGASGATRGESDVCTRINRTRSIPDASTCFSTTRSNADISTFSTKGP